MGIVHLGDCRAVMGKMTANSVDAIVTDPPYELGFMSRAWDRSGISYDVEVWRECLRILKPGGYLVAFGGSRTYHRIACAIEDAGFVIRDGLQWIYGCLSDDTEILIDGRWEPYRKATTGRRALCYNVDSDTYEWQPIQELLTYDYSDTAYRIHSDSTDQIVSRNHRCLVERGGSYVFQYAETLQQQARIPVLENLSGLLEALPLPEQDAGSQESGVRQGMQRGAGISRKTRRAEASAARRGVSAVSHGIRDDAAAGESALPEVLQQRVQRQGTRDESGQVFGQRQGQEMSRQGVAGGNESGMEGRRDLLSQEGQLCADQVCALPAVIDRDGAQRWLRDGASANRGAGDRATAAAARSGASRGSQQRQQCADESQPVRLQPRSQTVRASRYTVTDLATVEPLHYDGVVWCVRVPSGAFVARRNGKVFVTGNSGFPKSLNMAIALDKHFGLMAARGAGFTVAGAGDVASLVGTVGKAMPQHQPISDAAKQWDGYGTALKPAVEPICLAQKPLDGTYANNLLTHGVGALHVDACRVGEGTGIPKPPSVPNYKNNIYGRGMGGGAWENTDGRWPANILFGHSPDCADVCVEGCPVALLDAQSGVSSSSQGGSVRQPFEVWREMEGRADRPVEGGARAEYGDSGGASRYFAQFRFERDDWFAPFAYTAKAGRKERDRGLQGLRTATPSEMLDRKPDSAGLKHARAGANHGGGKNIHPTVKPVSVMRWLIRLVTPPGGLVFDPFTGSGATYVAAVREQMRFAGSELLPAHQEIAQMRGDYEARKGVQGSIFDLFDAPTAD